MLNLRTKNKRYYFNHQHEKNTTQQQPFHGPLSETTRVRRYQAKHSPTQHPDHHPIFTSFFHLPRSILLVKITCLAIFLHNLFPCPLWSTSWSGALHLIFHTFLHPILTPAFGRKLFTHLFMTFGVCNDARMT